MTKIDFRINAIELLLGIGLLSYQTVLLKAYTLTIGQAIGYYSVCIALQYAFFLALNNSPLIGFLKKHYLVRDLLSLLIVVFTGVSLYGLFVVR